MLDKVLNTYLWSGHVQAIFLVSFYVSYLILAQFSILYLWKHQATIDFLKFETVQKWNIGLNGDYTFLPIFHSIAEYQFQINNKDTGIRSLNIALLKLNSYLSTHNRENLVIISLKQINE